MPPLNWSIRAIQADEVCTVKRGQMTLAGGNLPQSDDNRKNGESNDEVAMRKRAENLIFLVVTRLASLHETDQCMGTRTVEYERSILNTKSI